MKTRQVLYHPEAKQELEAAILHYEERVEGLGLRFLESVIEAEEVIRAHSKAGAPFRFGCRKIAVRTFPFGIIYRQNADFLEIVAVAHDKRRPGYWRARAAV